METTRVGKGGAIILPAPLRRKLGILEGSFVVAEERPEGILIRLAISQSPEIYTPKRKAEFLLSNAIDEKDYRSAQAEVIKLKLDPSTIPHHRPRKSRR